MPHPLGVSRNYSPGCDLQVVFALSLIACLRWTVFMCFTGFAQGLHRVCTGSTQGLFLFLFFILVS